MLCDLVITQWTLRFQTFYFLFLLCRHRSRKKQKAGSARRTKRDGDVRSTVTFGWDLAKGKKRLCFFSLTRRCLLIKALVVASEMARSSHEVVLQNRALHTQSAVTLVISSGHYP